MQEQAEKKDLSKEKTNSFIADYRSLQAELVNTLKPSIGEVILNMNSSELKHLKEEVEKNHKKYSTTLSDHEKFTKKQMDSFKKNMEMFFGEVSDDQKKLYAEFIEQNYSYYFENLEFRKSYMVRLESLFEKKVELLEATVKYYSGDDSVKNKEFLEKQRSFLNNLNLLVQKIWLSLSETQHAEFKKSLAELKSDIEKLK